MKKLLVLFAVFALTAPVFAADGDPNVLIKCSGTPDAVVVSYELLAEDGFVPGDDLMRGIALKITTSNTALIDAISGYAGEFAGTPTADIPTGYSVFMGSIQFATDPNFVSSFGDPVAPSGDPGAGDDLPGAAEIVVELGSLYEEGVGTPPGTSGTLFTLTLDMNGESSTVLTIQGEATRGGDLGEAVLESGQQANVLSSGCTIGGECYVIGQPRYFDETGAPSTTLITQANYDAWVAVGNPECWCCPHHGYGDVDGNGFINFNDMVTIGYYAGDPAGSINCTRADVDHNGFTNFNDFLVVQPKIGGPQLPNTCTDKCGTKCPLEP